MADRGADVSIELAEVRTVHSRAQNALDTITSRTTRDLYAWEDPIDPDTIEMIAALTEVIRILQPWRRTGRAKKSSK